MSRMFDVTKARLAVWAANKTRMLLLPADSRDREIAESMLLDGAPVDFINQASLESWLERRQVKPQFLSEFQPAADTENGPLQPRYARR